MQIRPSHEDPRWKKKQERLARERAQLADRGVAQRHAADARYATAPADEAALDKLRQNTAEIDGYLAKKHREAREQWARDDAERAAILRRLEDRPLKISMAPLVAPLVAPTEATPPVEQPSQPASALNGIAPAGSVPTEATKEEPKRTVMVGGGRGRLAAAALVVAALGGSFPRGR